jgi:hypothetical protein
LLIHSKGLHKKEICKANCHLGYSPDIHIQHWCEFCEKWFHEQCSGERYEYPSISGLIAHLSEESKSSFDKLDPDFAFIAYSPVVHGKQYGPSSFEATQVKAKDLARDILEETVAADAWEEYLTDDTSVDGLLERQDQAVTYITCPNCSQLI